MALEQQSKFSGVTLTVDWPDPPKPATVAGRQVIAAEEFEAWLRDFSLALQATLDGAAREIESLKSAAK